MGETRAQPSAAGRGRRGRRVPPGEERPKFCRQAAARGCCPHGWGDFSTRMPRAGLGPRSEQGPESPVGAERSPWGICARELPGGSCCLQHLRGFGEVTCWGRAGR